VKEADVGGQGSMLEELILEEEVTSEQQASQEGRGG
jgi:hypothetical protein